MGVSRRERWLLTANVEYELSPRITDVAFATTVRRITREKQDDVAELTTWYRAIYPSIAQRLRCDAANELACALMDTLQVFCRFCTLHKLVAKTMLRVFKRVFATYSQSTPHLQIRMMRILFAVAATRPKSCARALGDVALCMCEAHAHASDSLTIAFLAHIVHEACSSFNEIMQKRLVVMCLAHIESDRSVKLFSSLRILSSIALISRGVLMESSTLPALVRALDATPLKFLRKRLLKDLSVITKALVPHKTTGTGTGTGERGVVPPLNDDDTCAICLDDLVAPCHMRCGHAFCAACVRRHLCTSPMAPVCPLCRQRIDGNDLVQALRG